MSAGIFEQIGRGEANAHVVFATHNTMAILDIAPACEGHTILFPKEPYQVLAQVPDELLVELFLALRTVRHATIIRDPTITGLTSIIAQGPAGGQRAAHLLIHTIPRFGDDGRFASERAPPDPAAAPLIAPLTERADGLLIELAERSRTRGEVLVIDESADVFEEIEPSRIGIFASGVREASIAIFTSFEAQGTTILIESGSSQERRGALAHVLPRFENDALAFEWQPGPASDLRSVAVGFSDALRALEQPKRSEPITRTNYLIKQLERIP